jgi:hypothetical protein
MTSLRRRLLLTAALIVCLVGGAFTQSATDKVYVTRTGAKYHRAGCSSLSKSKIEMSLGDAAARFTPCKNCKPPILAEAAPVTALAATPKQAPTARAAAIESGRCQATTKKGAQCSRKTKAGSRYCWQHGG